MPGIPDIALGADELLYVTEETTFGVWARPVAGDAVRVREIGFTRSQERVTRDDKLATRSHTERITRKKSVEWNVTAYLVPSGIDPSVTATPPDAGVLLKALFGAETVNAGVDVQYTLVRNQNISLTLHRICDHFAESLTGCVPNEATISWSGTDEPTLELTGFGKEWVITASHITGEAATITGTTLKIPRADDVCDVNSVVAFISGGTQYDNSGNGYHISAVTAGGWPSPVINSGVNDQIDFDEGSGTLSAILTADTYVSFTQLANEIKTRMELVGSDTYTVTWDADTEKITISSDGTSLDIDWATGTNTAGPTLGFTADDTGALSYTADESLTTGEITTDESGGWEAAFVSGAEIIPFFPAPTVQGSPENSILGGVQIDGSLDLNTTEGSIEYNGNMEARNDIFGEESAIGFSVSGRREVSATMTAYLQEQYAREVKDFNRFQNQHNVVVTFGSTAGQIMEVHLPEFEFDNVPFTVPEQEEATVDFTGMALDTSGPPFENEIYIVFK